MKKIVKKIYTKLMFKCFKAFFDFLNFFLIIIRMEQLRWQNAQEKKFKQRQHPFRLRKEKRA